METRFYVYALFRENGLPFYIGKGKGERWTAHEREARRGGRSHKCMLIRKMLAGRLEIPKIKLHQYLTEAKAHEYEVALIKAIGREHNGGPLVNLTDGGEGMSNPSSETRAKFAAAGRKGRGRSRSLETRAKIAQARRGRMHSPETCAKLVEGHRNRIFSSETRAKFAAAGRKGRGRIVSPETCAKLSEANHNRWAKFRATKAAPLTDVACTN